MFDCLAGEGWKASPYLPQGWILQTPALGVTNFFSKAGVFMDSFEKTLEFLRASGCYTPQEIQHFTMLQVESASFQMEDDLEAGGSSWLTSLDTSEGDSSQGDSSWLTTLELEAETDEAAEPPPGWSVKSRTLISPSGMPYASIKNALVALRKEGGEEEVVKAILRLPVARGWTSRNLPLGWIAKGTTAKYMIISPDGEFFESKAKAVLHLVAMGGSEQDKFKLERFTEGGKRAADRPYRNRTRVGMPVIKKEPIEFKKEPMEYREELTEFNGFNEEEDEVDEEEERDLTEEEREYLRASRKSTPADTGLGLWSSSDVTSGFLDFDTLAGKTNATTTARATAPEAGKTDGMTTSNVRRALQDLLRLGGSEEEAAPLRRLLVDRGWGDERLPRGWMGQSLPHSGYRYTLNFSNYCPCSFPIS